MKARIWQFLYFHALDAPQKEDVGKYWSRRFIEKAVKGFEAVDVLQFKENNCCIYFTNARYAYNQLHIFLIKLLAVKLPDGFNNL